MKYIMYTFIAMAMYSLCIANIGGFAIMLFMAGFTLYGAMRFRKQDAEQQCTIKTQCKQSNLDTDY